MVISHDQVKNAHMDEYPPIRSYCTYSPDPEDPWRAEDVIDPATEKPYVLDTSYIVKHLRPGKGPITEPLITSADGLSNASAFRPLLLTAAGQDDCYLRSEITQNVRGKSIAYEIHIVDGQDEQQTLDGSASLYIPYPEGMDAQSAADYDVTIVHTALSGPETFSTREGSIVCTPYGFCIQVSSLSPFAVSWQGMEAPSTGDAAQPALWLALLVLGALGLCVLPRSMRRFL